MDLGSEMAKFFCWTFQIGNLMLLLLWHTIHLIIDIWYFVLRVAEKLENFLISSGLLKRYKNLDLDKLKWLAIVVDSEEAHETSKVTEILQWLAALGVKNVCLYDAEGVLKKSKEVILDRSRVSKLFEEATTNVPLLDQKDLNFELASYSDGKGGVAKAANFLFVKYYLNGDREEPIFTEPLVAEALRAVGSGGPDPDLLLVFGPARCHLGFPPWRLRYTEIIHMGPLKSLKYGTVVKAIQKFSMVHQNYGT